MTIASVVRGAIQIVAGWWRHQPGRAAVACVSGHGLVAGAAIWNALVLSAFGIIMSYGCLAIEQHTPAEKFFAATNRNIQYTGRIDFSNPVRPRFWQPGVYIKAKFEGTSCRFIVNDQELDGKFHNYIEVIIDDTILYRLSTRSKTDTISVARNLRPGRHVIAVCKNTESSVGYLEFSGFLCEKLLPLTAKPQRRLEFIGDSITSGTDSDQSEMPCDKGAWEDHHNAYMSYGVTTARKLKAQWHISSLAGIGIFRSCCDVKVVMPQLFNKVNMAGDSVVWDVNIYQPDAVTVCLGQNDGIRDSTDFCGAYIRFIQKLRSYYPRAKIICLTSPMGNPELTAVLKNYITGIITYLNTHGEINVYKYFFSKRYHNGCDNHPSVGEHQMIANELSVYLSKLLHWNLTKN